MDNILKGLITWVESLGGKLHESVETLSLPGSGGNYIAVKASSTPIEAGDAIVVCPQKATLSFINALESDLLKFYAQSNTQSSIHQTTCLRLMLVEQYLLGPDSPWHPYIKSLPQPDRYDMLNTAMYYTDEELELIAETNLAKAITSRRLAWQEELAAALTTLSSQDKVNIKLWTWDLYLWAATIISSRGFPSLSRPRVSDQHSPVLIPLMDLLNHDPKSRVSWNFDAQSCCLALDERAAPGKEVFNNYGQKNNEELLMGYGFYIKDNPADGFGIGFNKPATSKIYAAFRARDQHAKQDDPIINNDATIDFDDSAISEQHHVRLAEAAPGYSFSPSFLQHFSILLENKADRNRGGCDWAKDQVSFTSHQICRNKVATLAGAIELLRAPLVRLLKSNPSKDKMIASRRGQDALAYRSSQIRILQQTLGHLKCTLQDSIINHHPHSQLLRLAALLSNDAVPSSFTSLVRDFRSITHQALGTRNASSIRRVGGEECAFTFWLCAIWTLYDSDPARERFACDAFTRDVEAWLDYLRRAYGYPPSSAQASYEMPCLSTDEDDIAVAESYLEVILAQKTRSPDTLYSSSSLTLPFLLWCIGIVKEEGLYVGIYTDNKDIMGAEPGREPEMEMVMVMHRDGIE